MRTIADRPFIRHNFAAANYVLTDEIFTEIYNSLIRDENSRMNIGSSITFNLSIDINWDIVLISNNFHLREQIFDMHMLHIFFIMFLFFVRTKILFANVRQHCRYRGKVLQFYIIS